METASHRHGQVCHVGHIECQSKDSDEVADFITKMYTPVKISPLCKSGPMGLSGTFCFFPGIKVQTTRFEGDGMQVAPQRNCEAVFASFPVSGAISVQLASGMIDTTSSCAVAIEGGQFRSVSFHQGRHQQNLTITHALFAKRLGEILDRPARGKIVFAPVIDFKNSKTAAIAATIDYLTHPEFIAQSKIGPLTGKRLGELLIDMMLETWPSNYSDDLSGRPNTIAPRHVKLSIDYIHAHAMDFPDPAFLAKLSGVSLRALQYGFQNFVGQGIAEYQRSVRLNQARQEIRGASDISPQEIARRFGFSNFSRFKKLYEKTFGEKPETR